MDTRSIKPKLFEIIEPVALDAGFEVVDLALVRESVGWVLRVFIDAAGTLNANGEAKSAVQSDSQADVSSGEHSAVHIDDCARFSRELSAILDVDDPIPSAYNLEVSSPGIDRPLRTLGHFEAAVGETAEVRVNSEVAGPRDFTGIVVSTDSKEANVDLNVDGQLRRVAISDIASAKLVPDWDKLLGAKNNKNGSGKTASNKNASKSSSGSSGSAKKSSKKSAKTSAKNVSAGSTKTHRPRNASFESSVPSQVK